MYASNLSYFLGTQAQHSDVSDDGVADVMARFESLRSYRRLPYGRQNRAKHLSNEEIASAVLGMASIKPSWAGHAATILGDLRPVGGSAASIFGASNLTDAIVKLISDKAARDSLVSLSLTSAGGENRASGSAQLTYRAEGVARTVWFVSHMAITLMQPGMESMYDPSGHEANVARYVGFNRRFFNELARAIDNSLKVSHEPMGDGSEYEAGEAEEARRNSLGCTPRSRFLNVGVDTQVTWPKKEQVVLFDQYKLVLMPKTREYTQSVHIDLTANKLDDGAALTVINRFLSVLSWCDDQFAKAERGWSGHAIPVPVSKRDLAFATAHEWPFYRSIPGDENARRALALYREGLNAEAMSLTSYAVLSYFKIVELGFRDDDQKVKSWIARALPGLLSAQAGDARVIAFMKDCGQTLPGDYLWLQCRVAVAHASRKSPTDADDSTEIRRLGVAADVLQQLAKMLIMEKFAISDSPFTDVANQP